MKNKKIFSGNYFKEFGTAVAKGDIWVKLSMLIMGAGYIARKQIINGLIMIALEAVFIITYVFYAAPNLAKFGTLGTVQFEQVFDPLTLTIKAVYRLQKQKEAGKHINSFREDIKALFNEKFHITLLTLPALGIILMNIIPILVLIAIAFTNYDQQHMPPSALFTWVGWKNFKQLFTNSTTLTFGYSFGKILIWTLEWAVLSTLTTFIGGILMAQFINSKKTKLPKLWRTLFMVAIAVPQFVTLLLVRNFFADSGIVNTICSNIGLTDFLKSVGLVNANLTYIPFLTNPTWAKVMIVLINIWVGVPYQMLIATGVLMNIPVDQLESARIDGANSFQIFWKITMPYVLFITGPSLITDFVRNINNFNVIYLLTQDVYVTSDQLLANSNAKEVDLLVTWLFRLTNEYYNYKIASVIGIIVFIICAGFTLITFTQTIKGSREEDFR